MAEEGYITHPLNVPGDPTKTVMNYLEILNKIRKISGWEWAYFEDELSKSEAKGDVDEGSATAFYRYSLRYKYTGAFLTEYWSMVSRIIDASNPDKELVKTLTTDNGKISLIEKICSAELRHSTSFTNALSTLAQYRAKGNKEAGELVENVYNRFPGLKPENSQ